MEKGTTNGTITGIDGDFSLNMSPNGTRVVSFVCYKTQEVQVKGQKQLQVVLSEDAEIDVYKRQGLRVSIRCAIL